MPVYNARRYLAEAVDSILAQSFGDFELILIDDGSNDGSLELLRQYEQQDRRIRLTSRENRGLVRTLNEALGLARGRLIARMDADDIALPQRFAAQVETMNRDGGLVCLAANYQLMDAAGRKLLDMRLPLEDAEIQSKMLEGHSSICHPLAMIRREALERIGGYDESFPHAEDLDLWLRLGEVGRLANLPQVLLRYRLHDKALSEAAGAEQHHWSRVACERAWQRRGIEGAFRRTTHHRPGQDGASRHAATLQYGWWAFGSGERRTAMIYGLKSVARRPFENSGWKLLLCAALKRRPQVQA